MLRLLACLELLVQGELYRAVNKSRTAITAIHPPSARIVVDAVASSAEVAEGIKNVRGVACRARGNDSMCQCLI